MKKLVPRVSQSDHLVQGNSVSVWRLPLHTGEEPPELAFHTRRPHQKSRLGCVVCKKRRVKCDEKKPICGRCDYRGANCVYKEPERISRDQKSSGSRERPRDETARDASPRDIMAPATTAVEETANQVSLQPNSLDCALSTTGAAHSPIPPKLVESLRHFDFFTSHTMGAPIARHVMRSQVLPLASSAPYLMHSLIATSLSHIRHLQPINHNATRISEAHHWQQAITLFKQELSSPVKLENMDSVISTCMLLTVLSYTSDSHDPSASWVFCSQPQTSWLFIQGGLHALIDKYAPTIANSVWMPVMRDADDFTGSDQIQNPGRDGIPEAFADLCDIDNFSSSKNNPYHGPLRVISALLQLEFTSKNFAKFVFFLRMLRGEYANLLQKKDPRALLILSYWFAILCKVDQWWIHARAMLECGSVCVYLENNEDPRIVNLLKFPAEACGYTLASQNQYRGSLSVDGNSTSSYSPS